MRICERIPNATVVELGFIQKQSKLIMEGQVISALDEVGLYLFPGMFIGMTYLYSFHGDILKNESAKPSMFSGIVLFAIFYLIGILCFQISELFIFLYVFIFQVNPLQSIIQPFSELGALKAFISSKIPLQDPNNLEVYRYSKIIVLSANSESAANAERMMAIGHLFRSLFFALPLSVLIYLSKKKNRINIKLIILMVIGLLVVEILFAKMYMSYWGASVLQYLRTAVIYSTGM